MKKTPEDIYKIANLLFKGYMVSNIGFEKCKLLATIKNENLRDDYIKIMVKDISNMYPEYYIKYKDKWDHILDLIKDEIMECL